MSGFEVAGGAAGGAMNALGWTLLHFVWQGGVIALLLWCGLSLMGGASARARYGLCCVALLMMFAAPVVTYALLGGLEGGGSGVAAAAAWVVNVNAVSGSGAHEPPVQRLMEMLQGAAPVLPWVWLAGVAVRVARLGMGLMAARRLRRVGVRAVEGQVVGMFTQVAERVGVKRAVRLLESVRVEAPTVVGWLRPVVLLPACCFAGMSVEQMEALLAHELAHIRRHDYLLSVLQSVLEALLFYHPAVWWVSRQVRKERECCCDEVAAECCGDVLEYARALSWLEEKRLVGTAVGLGANGGVLRMRIRRVLGYRDGSVASQMGAVAVLCVLVAGAAAVLVREARAERNERSAYDAVVKTAEQSGSSLRVSAAGALSLKQAKGIQAGQTPVDAAGVQLATMYANWLDQDVVWIITPEERNAFLQLGNDDQRNEFINSFWLRRDAAGAAPNSVKLEHYQRVAYANGHFGDATDLPGWKSDRGHAFVLYGRPEWVESHPGGGADLIGRQVSAPFEVWHYGSIPGVGDDVNLEFMDSCHCGEYGIFFSRIGAAPAVQGAAGLESPVVWGLQSATKRGTANAFVQAASLQIPTSGVLDGVIVDPTGAVVPRGSVSVANTESGERRTTQTDDEGRYSFSVPVGRYTVDAAAVGFRTAVARNVQVSAADPAHMVLKLQVGGTTESMKVSGSAAAGSAAGGQGPDGPVRVSQGVMAAIVASQPPPVYPAIAKAAHVQGTVLLHALISKQGTVENLSVISGPSMLRAAAMDAVRQWSYRPYLLNGQPVEVETTINVNFTFGESVVQPAAPAPGASREAGRPIRVSAGVMAGAAIKRVPPVYPDDAKAARVQGIVVLHAVVSKEGEIEDLQVVSGPQELTQSAVDAVKQWEYKPFLLNGEPVEVESMINVNYTLAD